MITQGKPSLKEAIESMEVKPSLSINMLKELAIYLEGVKAGKGNLAPLGTIHLENLWIAINELRLNQKPDGYITKE